MGGFLNWWDGVELWLSGLGFVAQTAVVMPVVLALAYGIAILLDGALGNGIRLRLHREIRFRGGRKRSLDLLRRLLLCRRQAVLRTRGGLLHRGRELQALRIFAGLSEHAELPHRARLDDLEEPVHLAPYLATRAQALTR